MSIDMILEDSQSQAQTTTSYCQHQLEGYQAIQQAINQFVSDTESLKGKAYDSARAFAETVLQALARGGELYEESLSQLISKLPNDYIEMVDGKSWREDELLQRIDQQQQCLNVLEEAELQLSLISVMSLERKTSLHQYHAELIEMHAELKRTYEEILEKLYAFDTYSASIFDALADIDTQMTLGLSQIDQSWNAQTGTFQAMTNMSWATVLNNQYAVKDVKATNEEKAFMANLMTQYGFDAETAQIILDVKRGIDKEFPKLSQDERDYLLLLTMGNFVYGEDAATSSGISGKIKGYIKDAMWFNTAGTYHEVDGRLQMLTAEEFLTYLGIKQKDIDKLRYNVRLQNQISSDNRKDIDFLKARASDYQLYKQSAESIYGTMTDAEFEAFWDSKYQSYANQADFAHQSITMATILYQNPMRNANLYTLNNEKTNDLAGWRGDTTDDAFVEPSIGNDDYKADLDAVNITELMKTGLSYQEATNRYYADLGKGTYTRADKFLEYKDLDDIKSTIYDSLVPKDYHELASGNSGYYVSKSEEECEQYLKEHYSASADFITALENGQNELYED
ncbi:LXG domain-containing protein [Streptococcus gallolyticus subsp. gallolyticus]|uniref:LXG domain-containing protein n=1 Tax=Streptococcus gallolyticus TaxID=315405 RepID=UPI002000CB6D|nr:LXG domain-containing protein [Streptococcus gallolyticus]MCY7155653.1 LXG domain-containing protein [Streptococcus gallolyticus subsp. gallolyticus]MCY7174410.1 LXG domain-containing protein [Streptococcus gallolyticus subsp. gallolyticus]MCY7176530.1 LXG domain-containing protein [Streptococcus gallolyticus subsp. gallolyticus]MCY7180983.1 LXG domain-containing protein [Streptococcus gallolyticus subsp. gallolyticus]MCY7198536.1 LXG domain-containing protein [Streptococcus gallolyticus su